MIFVPDDYIFWVFKYPYSRFLIIIVLYLFLVFFYFFFKKYKVKTFFSQKRKVLWTGFIVSNFIGFYIIFTSVTVITQENIIDHSFLHPQGKKYDYHDVVKIEASVRGDKYYFPFTHNKGDFIYKLEFTDGKVIDFNDEHGGVGENIVNDPNFVLNKFDERLVGLGIPKESNMENFHYATEYLGDIYTDQIKSILERK